jgi:hypothetical protein
LQNQEKTIYNDKICLIGEQMTAFVLFSCNKMGAVCWQILELWGLKKMGISRRRLSDFLELQKSFQTMLVPFIIYYFFLNIE